MLAAALQAEVAAYINAHAGEVDESGYRLVVRNGYHQPRECHGRGCGAGASTGFRRLAGYIFGGNHGNANIALTAPVARQSGQKIAMTAPVSKSSDADGGSVVGFFMPAGWTMDTLPEPNDDEVSLVTVPEETVAVLRFTGNRRSAAVSARTTGCWLH